jgi:uncharacterized protein (DUF427 family)
MLSRHIVVIFNDLTIADTVAPKRVLETSHPPVYYIPPADINTNYLRQLTGGSYCEWKGRAQYFDVEVRGRVAAKAAWSYPAPTSAFVSMRDYVAFYPALMDACFVDGEQVQPQPGGFYGGWITSDIVGPFKGDPGTMYW